MPDILLLVWPEALLLLEAVVVVVVWLELPTPFRIRLLSGQCLGGGGERAGLSEGANGLIERLDLGY